MAIIRWEAFREIEGVQRQMNRLFDQMMSYSRGWIYRQILSSLVPTLQRLSVESATLSRS